MVRCFERLRALPPERLTDLQRAARFLYLQRLAFGGQVDRQTFGVAREQGARFNVARLEPMLADLHERLAGVVVEQLPFGEFLRRYDHVDTLFYLDPPYWGNEGDYGAGLFERADFERMAAALAALRGRFVLSLNDVPGVRETFGAFRMTGVATTYTAAAKQATPARELLISNVDLA